MSESLNADIVSIEWQDLRELVIHRDNGTCQKCGHQARGYVRGEHIPTGHYEVHHLIERQNGGTDNPDNLLTLCDPCHRAEHLKPVGNGRAAEHKQIIA